MSMSSDDFFGWLIGQGGTPAPIVYWDPDDATLSGSEITSIAARVGGFVASRQAGVGMQRIAWPGGGSGYGAQASAQSNILTCTDNTVINLFEDQKPFTLMMRLRRTGNSSGVVFDAVFTVPTSKQFRIQITTTIVRIFRATGSDYFDYASTYTTNTSYTYAFVYNGTTMLLYRNGSLISSTGSAGSPPGDMSNNQTTQAVSLRGTSATVTSTIHGQWKIWNVALTAAEVAAEHTICAAAKP